MLAEPFITNGITFAFCVLAPVDFDYETTFSTHEVNNVASNWLLTHELETVQLA